MLVLQCPTTEGSAMADMTSKSPPGVLRAEDVADLWTAERRKARPDAPAYKAVTVLTYLRESQQSLKGPGQRRRYASHPMPTPAGRFGLMPWWLNAQREELLDWFRNRPGQSHGRGGWPAGRPRRPRTTS